MEATILFLVAVYTTVFTHNLDHNIQGIARSHCEIDPPHGTHLVIICCTYCSLIKPEKYSGNRRGAYASEISTIGSENQVKTYMDSSNGVRNASSNAYNKVRASAILLVFFTFIFFTG